MRIPFSWLREFVDLDLTPQDAADRLTMLGLEVEAVEEIPGLGSDQDWVLVVYVTPNRGDCLSVRGIARELCAALQVPQRNPEFSMVEKEPAAAEQVTVRIEDPELCPRYVARLIRDIRVGPSPEWMVRRLEASGVRSINNVVDVTNYVMLELGQPLHAFDFAVVEEGQIVVRRARPGETLTTLDGKERELFDEALVIADVRGGGRPVALAGIMGGQDTEVGAATRHILLESAHFDPRNNRRTARRLGLQTESSLRFSRGVDPLGCALAADRAAALIAELAGGEVAAGCVDVVAKPPEPRRLSLGVARTNSLLGTQLGAGEIAGYLNRLEFDALEGDPVSVGIPSFRPDCQREVDLIEEVARLHGYDSIPASLPPVQTAVGGIGPRQRLSATVREILLRFGLTEVITYSLTSPEVPDLLGLPEDDFRRKFVAVANPMSLEASVLRSLLSAGVLEVVARNLRRRNPNVLVFEIGKTYHPIGQDRGHPVPGDDGRNPSNESSTEERLAVAIAMTGSLYGSRWNLPADRETVDFFVLKAVVQGLLETLVGSAHELRPGGCDLFSPECRAEILVDGCIIGACGTVHPRVLERMDVSVQSPIFVGEMDLEPLVQRQRSPEMYRRVSRFPETMRDLAFVVDQSASHREVREAILAAGGALLDEVDLFDVFSGPPLPEGKKNLAFTLTFRSPDRTLMDEEVDALIQGIIEHTEAVTGAVLRE